MTYKELSNPRLKMKPRFYESHKLILQQTLLEDSVMALYLLENMLQFYQDPFDMADCMDIYSELDGYQANVEYQYGNQQYINEVSTLNALIECMAVTECNMHGGDQIGSKKAVMLQMQVP